MRKVLLACAALGFSGCARHPAPTTAVAAVAPALRRSEARPAGEGASVAHDFFLRARRMEMEGNDAVALGYYRIAFEYDPQSRDLCFLLVDRLKDAGHVDSAVTLGRTCLGLQGSPASAEYQSLGEAYLRRGDMRQALECYRQALELDEDDKDALYTLAGLYEKLQDFPRYAETMEKLLPRLEYPPRLVEKLLQVYRFLGRADAMVPFLREAWRKSGRASFGENLAAYYEARVLNRSFLEVAETLARENPDHAGYELLRARALNSCQMPDSALGAYQALLKSNPDAQEVLFPYAALLHDLGKYDQAYPVFEKLAAAFPRHPLYQYFLGSAGLELRRPESRAALQRAAALEPAVPDYWARLVYADLVFGSDSAESRLQHLPDSGEGWQSAFFRGLVHALLAKHLEPRSASEPTAVLEDSVASRRFRIRAVDFFRAALAQSPQNRRILFELGSNLERLGRRADAVETLRKLVKLDTANAVAMNYLGYMLVEDNRDLDFAGKLIDRALALEPENGAYLDSKGWWYYRKGNFSAARAYLGKAAARYPKDSTILEHLKTVNRNR